MKNWNEVDFDSVLGDELNLDGALNELNQKYGMNFELGSVVRKLEQELTSEKAGNHFSLSSPSGEWIPCTLTDEQMELVSGGGSWVAVNQYVVVQTAVAANAAVVVNAAVGVGAVAAVVAAVIVVIAVAGVGGGGGGGGGGYGGGGGGGGDPEDPPRDEE